VDKMKKEVYAINDGQKTEYRTVTGYTERIETNNGYIFVGYDFRKDIQRWIATDIKTGLAISPSTEKKKENVIAFVHRNADFIHGLIEKALSEKNQYSIGSFRLWANEHNLNQTHYE
jgi:hypothetical protein